MSRASLIDICSHSVVSLKKKTENRKQTKTIYFTMVKEEANYRSYTINERKN